MNFHTQWDSISAELEAAQVARTQGNEGRARVCARRAAGIAARRYLEKHQSHPVVGNAFELLEILQDLPSLSAELREYAAHLCLRVNQQYELPPEMDLIADARNLIAGLVSTAE